MSNGDTWPVLRSGDLTLRVLAPEDADAFLAGEDDEQRRWLWYDASRHSTRETVEDAIRRWRASWAAGGPVHQWGVFRGAGAVLVGGVELRDRGDGFANVSYVVFPAARRQGVATAAARIASRWALENMNVDAVVAIVNPTNLASLGVLRRAGFVSDGMAESAEHDSPEEMRRFVLAGPQPPR
jgi:RimJ/RimL family protein N-acetyltransferase